MAKLTMKDQHNEQDLELCAHSERHTDEQAVKNDTEFEDRDADDLRRSRRVEFVDVAVSLDVHSACRNSGVGFLVFRNVRLRVRGGPWLLRGHFWTVCAVMTGPVG